MLKASGLLLVFACGTLMGIRKAENMERSVRQLELICGFLREFALLLRSSMGSPTELVLRLARETSYGECDFVSSLAEECGHTRSMQAAMRSAAEKTDFGSGHVGDVLSELGSRIGTRDIDSQLSAIEAAVLLVSGELDGTRERVRRGAPLFRRLGALGGLFAAILLI